MPRITVDVARSPRQRELAMGVWRAANAARRRPAGNGRAARVRQKIETAELLTLAHYGDRPAGMVLAETYLEDGVPVPSVGHVSMVFVDPAVWGCGVGGRLLRDLQARQWPQLSVWTRTDNVRARRLYVSAGFVDTANRSKLHDGDEIMQFMWAAGRGSCPG